ncbi:MAG: hypothetical protein R3202_03500 [Candidatus Competibacterales bacterium]|nr:hypothetical protein [Candidatus Competibacterales bacterium]
MNINKALKKEYESKSLQELPGLPVVALQGISEATAEQLKALGVKTIRDLAESKYVLWAQGICNLSGTEE